MSQDIRELLELAAKACGYSIHDWCDGAAWAYKIGSELDFYGELPIFKWAPHLDDGDGARMEAQNYIQLSFYDSYVRANLHGDSGCVEKYKNHNGDRQAARKMASLRVAAEIGRRMAG